MDSFDHDMAPDTAADPGTGKRSRTRDSLFLIARLTVDGDAEARDVRIRNLSAGGMMADVDRTIAVSTRVMLDVRGLGEIGGHVAWCTDGRIGIALDRPIDPMRARKPVGGGTTTPVYAKAVVYTRVTGGR